EVGEPNAQLHTHMGKRALVQVAAADCRAPEPAAARSTFDLFAIVSKPLSIRRLRSLADPWATPDLDRSPHDRLARRARRLERDLIRTRTSEGYERAKLRGVRLGRKPSHLGAEARGARERRSAGEILMDIARSYNVSFATNSRLRLARY